MVEGHPDVLEGLVPSVQLANRALEIANALAHPASDCFYIAPAELRGTRMVTDDRRLLDRLKETVYARSVVHLKDA
jgi:predicted nucleic acid-binding protein